MNHLTDGELIDYTLKYDNDPIRTRLARIMDNMPGFILKRLEDVGMNPETCLFENTYDPGDYINHLENEIDYLSREINVLQGRLEELETMTVLEFMEAAKKKIEAEQRHNQLLMQDIRKANDERDHMKSKLSMWTKLNGHGV